MYKFLLNMSYVVLDMCDDVAVHGGSYVPFSRVCACDPQCSITVTYCSLLFNRGYLVHEERRVYQTGISLSLQRHRFPVCDLSRVTSLPGRGARLAGGGDRLGEPL